MGGLDLITLTISDTSSDIELWESTWVIPSVEYGQYVATITLVNETNDTIVLEKTWNILPENIRANDNQSDRSTNETPDQLHQTTNQTD